MKGTDAHEGRVKLLAGGFIPLPAIGKEVKAKEWTTATVDAAWLWRYRSFPNTALRCDGLLAVDVDVDEPGLVAEVQKLVFEHLGLTGYVRVRGPRRLYLYRECDPSPAYMATSKRPGARVELLRTARRSCMAVGTHPSGDVYRWEMPLTRLGAVPVAQPKIEELLAACEALFDSRGLTVESPASGAMGALEQVPILTDDMRFTVLLDGDELELSVRDIEVILGGAQKSIACHLDGVRPGSDSGAGSARLQNERLVITDFVANKIYTRASEAAPVDIAEDFGASNPFTDWCFITAENSYMPLARPDIRLPVQGFDGRFGAGASRQYLASATARKIDGFAYRPDRSEKFIHENGLWYFNTVRWPRHPTEGGSIDTWYAFLESLIPDAEERQLFEEWIAVKLQKPSTRCHGVLMIAPETYGAGRGTLFEIIRRLVGEWNTQSPSFETLAGTTYQSQYNDWVSGTLFALVAEVCAPTNEAGAKANLHETLKQLIDTSGGTVLVNRKGKANTREHVMASFILASNHAVPFPIPATDRRFLVIANGGPLKLALSREVWRWLDDPANIGALRRRLQSLPIEKYSPFGPVATNAKDRLVSSSVSPGDLVAQWIRDNAPGAYTTNKQLGSLVDLAIVALELPEEDNSRKFRNFMRTMFQQDKNGIRVYRRLRDGTPIDQADREVLKNEEFLRGYRPGAIEARMN
jgi:hypothetical protein